MVLDSNRQGVILGVATYMFWGISPIYFKLVDKVTLLEVLSHRILWSLMLLCLIVTISRNWKLLGPLLPHIKTLLLTSLLIAINWLIFIWAISNGQMIETSLGYFISPLVSVLLGLIFLSERLRMWQWCSISLALVGVSVQLVAYAQIPWIAVSLALSFGFYGLLKKQLNLSGVISLMVETAVLAPVALGYLLFLHQDQKLVFLNQSMQMDLLLMSAGIVTTLPLVGFAAAVVRLSLTSIGLLQYIAPTITLVIAVVIYHEPFDSVQLISFSCIWIALAIFSLESYSFHNRTTDA